MCRCRHPLQVSPPVNRRPGTLRQRSVRLGLNKLSALEPAEPIRRYDPENDRRKSFPIGADFLGVAGEVLEGIGKPTLDFMAKVSEPRPDINGSALAGLLLGYS